MNIESIVNKIIEVEKIIDGGLFDNYHNFLDFEEDLREEINDNGFDNILEFYVKLKEDLEGVEKKSLQDLINILLRY